MNSPSFNLVGVWRLKSAVIIDQESGERTEMYGANVLGRAIFEATGRMIVMLVPSGRSHADSDADADQLFGYRSGSLPKETSAVQPCTDWLCARFWRVQRVFAPL